MNMLSEGPPLKKTFKDRMRLRGIFYGGIVLIILVVIVMTFI